MQKTAAAGFDAHLTKPVNPDDLLEAISRRNRS
jgi:CheY-like chemotaxis protein